MIENKIEASIGFSRNLKSREAGYEVAKTAIDKLNRPPSFFLLFTTNHYEKRDGFQELLNGVWDILPKGIPLIGGTIAGFINNYGCFAYGATALAVSYPNMDVAVGYGKKTKRHPKVAAIKCSKMIKKTLAKSKYENKFVIEMISAPIIPKIPFIGDTNNVKSRIMGYLLARLGMPIAHYFGTGIGKEQDVLDKLVKNLSDFYVIGGSSVDDGKMLSNSQFINDRILTNSIVALGATIDKPVLFQKINGVHKTEKKFKITKTMFNDYIIRKINNTSATNYFLKEILKIPSELFYNLGPFYYKTADYLPFSFEENSDRIIGVGSFLGDNILVSHKIPGKNAVMCTTNGEELFQTVNSCVSNFPDNIPFMFLSSSTIYSFILRNKTHLIKNIITNKLGKTPFLMIQPMIEHTYEPNGKPNVCAYSTNALSFLIN